MSNTQHTGKRGLLAALLATVIVSAAVLAGCGGGEEESNAATADSVVKGTQKITEVVSGVALDKNGQPITDKNGNYVKATQGTTAAKQNSQSKQTSKADNKQQSQASAANNNNQTSKANNQQQSSKSGGGSNNNNANSKSGGSGSSKSREPAPQNTPTAPVNNKSENKQGATDLTIGNKHFKVGDTVTCTYYLKVPEKMLNFQGAAYFDPELLELSDAYLIEPANNGGMLNNNLKDHVSFNGSNLSGYDFIDECYPFITVEYKVTGTGVTQPGIKFDVITDVNDKAYATENGSLSGGAEIREEYK